MIASLALRAFALVVVMTAFAAPASAMGAQASAMDVQASAMGAQASAMDARQAPGLVSAPLGEPAALPPVRVAYRPVAFEAPKPAGFFQRQLDHPRVQRAYERKAERVEAALEARGVEDLGEVFFRVFKREQELEVWAREPGTPGFTLVKTYPVCEVSGRLGPKRREGDRQIPEGFYSIDTFNPRSRFHLSMRVDYPNAVDRARGQEGLLGGDIYIHGGCATIGCVPVTDGYIEELYLVAAAARDAGQRQIPVHIFPTRLDSAGLDWLAENYGTHHADYGFWQNLQQGYLAFEGTRQLPVIGHDAGRYTFAAPPITRSALAPVRTRAAAAILPATPLPEMLVPLIPPLPVASGG